MNSIEINITNLNSEQNIYIDITKMQININGKIKTITEDQINSLLRIIRAWSNNNSTKILDDQKFSIIIDNKEVITGSTMLQDNYIELESWINELWLPKLYLKDLMPL